MTGINTFATSLIQTAYLKDLRGRLNSTACNRIPTCVLKEVDLTVQESSDLSFSSLPCFLIENLEHSFFGIRTNFKRSSSNKLTDY